MPQVKRIMDRIGAGHTTFGGRLEANPQGGGWMARSMANKTSGDWRDAGQVDAWVADVALTVEARHQTPSA